METTQDFAFCNDEMERIENIFFAELDQASNETEEAAAVSRHEHHVWEYWNAAPMPVYFRDSRGFRLEPGDGVYVIEGHNSLKERKAYVVAIGFEAMDKKKGKKRGYWGHCVIEFESGRTHKIDTDKVYRFDNFQDHM